MRALLMTGTLFLGLGLTLAANQGKDIPKGGPGSTKKALPAEMVKERSFRLRLPVSVRLLPGGAATLSSTSRAASASTRR
jgi:hypothetical protein